MNQLTTAFEITSGTNGIREDLQFRLVVGVVVLIAGILGLILRKKAGGRFPKILGSSAFLTGWGILWLIVHISLWISETADIDHLLDLYHSGQSQIVEGVVHVSYEQKGHDAGDKIIVGDRRFEVNYYLFTPGYKQNIFHGGVLREGVFARLHYHEGVILKVEVGNKTTGRKDSAEKSHD